VNTALVKLKSEFLLLIDKFAFDQNGHNVSSRDHYEFIFYTVETLLMITEHILDIHYLNILEFIVDKLFMSLGI
jgi:hypothetical protein